MRCNAKKTIRDLLLDGMLDMPFDAFCEYLKGYLNKHYFPSEDGIILTDQQQDEFLVIKEIVLNHYNI